MRGGLQDVGTPFLEATETEFEPSPHREFFLKVHPGDSIYPTASHLLLWRGKVSSDTHLHGVALGRSSAGSDPNLSVGIALHSSEGQWLLTQHKQ